MKNDALKMRAEVPAVVVGSWDRARHWLTTAKACHEAGLLAQVMVGLELLALRASYPETRGRPSRGEISPATGLISARVPFADAIQAETGLGRTQAFELIRMAQAAIPRLREQPALEGFDPSQGVGALDDSQREALTETVRKLTDGLSQIDFLEALGLCKTRRGSAARGGALSQGAPADVGGGAEREAEIAIRDFAAAELALTANPIRFTLLPEPVVEAQIGTLERILGAQIRARREWLRGNRNLSAIEQILAANA